MDALSWARVRRAVTSCAQALRNSLAESFEVPAVWAAWIREVRARLGDGREPIRPV